MSDTTPARVRVTGPPRRPAGRRTPPAREIDQDSEIGAVYMASLLREQLRLALVVLGALALTLGSLPALFHFFPALAAARVAGMPLSWLVLGVLAYPWLFALGWFYVRRAEATERDFIDLVNEVEQ